MDHRAYKTLRMPLAVPEGFTVEQVGSNPTTPANRQDCIEEQYKFITTAAASQPGEIHKIPGYMRSPTLGFIQMLYSLMDCVGYISWLMHEGLDSTLDMTTFYIFKVNLQTDELFQKVYQKQVTLFNRGYISALQHTCTWTLSTIEKVQGHMTNFYQRYNLILQHVVIPMETVLKKYLDLDRAHAALTMALHHYSYAAVQPIAEPLRTIVIQYIVEHGMQLTGSGTILVAGQVGHSEKLQDIDGTTTLSQQQGYRLLNKKRLLDDN